MKDLRVDLPKEVPESLLNGYFDCNVILDHKKETMGDPGHLARMSSCGLGVVEGVALWNRKIHYEMQTKIDRLVHQRLRRRQ